ncbi:MAG: DUF3800 domain-containing protein [Sphingobacteriales bacterium]|nr:MAG: DUF3800 domain-containing protein [Sphingobacteriales bacterium]
MAFEGKRRKNVTLRKRKSGPEYIIWCDESDKKGQFFSNFYGGVLVASDHLKEVQTTLMNKCADLHFFDEIKWQKVSEHYLDKYISIMDCFFNLVKSGLVKVRIMFTQNAYVPTKLTDQHYNDEFFILYYQFIKHAFGMSYRDNKEKESYLRVYFDYLPDTLEKRQRFKEYIKGLQTLRSFQLANVRIRKQDIAEIDSKKHLLLQMLDVILGSICFRLNNKHKLIPEGKKRRGKRTIAKEKLYKFIHSKICELRPNFNTGSSTQHCVWPAAVCGDDVSDDLPGCAL